jgi:hypothetical protein
MIAVFAFDHSSSHTKVADDSLNAFKMNLNPGGKQPVMRNTIYNGKVQQMVLSNDYPDEKLHGKPKGMRIILQERGLWRPNLKASCNKNG